MTTLHMVKSNPVAGKEDAYNRWYSDVHLPVLRIDGFQTAQRFKRTRARYSPITHILTWPFIKSTAMT